MADNTEKIEELEEILDLGTTRIKTDGTEVEIDPDAVRRRLGELKRQDDTYGDPRPPFSSVFLGGF